MAVSSLLAISDSRWFELCSNFEICLNVWNVQEDLQRMFLCIRMTWVHDQKMTNRLTPPQYKSHTHIPIQEVYWTCMYSVWYGTVTAMQCSVMEYIWSHIVLYGNIRDCTLLYRYVWTCMGRYPYIWACMGMYGHVLVYMLVLYASVHLCMYLYIYSLRYLCIYAFRYICKSQCVHVSIRTWMCMWMLVDIFICISMVFSRMSMYVCLRPNHSRTDGHFQLKASLKVTSLHFCFAQRHAMLGWLLRGWVTTDRPFW